MASSNADDPAPISRRGSSSFSELWRPPHDAFGRQNNSNGGDDDEDFRLRWAAIERLPTFERLRRGVVQRVLADGRAVLADVDVARLGARDRQLLVAAVLKLAEQDNEKFLRRLRDRIDRAGIKIPKIEVRFERVSIEGDVYVGSRALPTLFNATLNVIESVLGLVRLFPTKKKKIQILKDVSGIIKPSRMTLLLGPPSAGKTTLLLALAGKLEHDLRVSGKVTYCGHEMNEFVPQRTCAYISQHDLHYGEMTVRETLNFSGRCLGVGTKYELLAELTRREAQAGIKPDPEIDAFMKATAMSGQKTSLVTDYVLKILGLDICADIVVGDDMRRGISGGQKKRLTIGEMLVGPAKVLLMDEISNGLDSSTTFQICNYIKQTVHISDITAIASLLQPSPEIYDLFDDIILLSEGQIVYQGPRENVLEFFEHMGFKCPERKGVADFLQEVTSKNDQEQYWLEKEKPYKYVTVPEFVAGFKSFHVGQQLESNLKSPYDKSRTHRAALEKRKFGIKNWELLKACFAREWLLMKRNAFIYAFKGTQITVMAIICFTVFLRTRMPVGDLKDGGKFFGALFFGCSNVLFNGLAEMALTIFKLPVFYKQRDSLFYPSWAFGLPACILKIPISFLESVIWLVLTYYTIGFAPAPSRFCKQFLAFFCLHQMALSYFRLVAALGRKLVLANIYGTFAMLLIFVLGGFVISRNDLDHWMAWAYYVSPLMYAQNAVVMNEFLDERWSTPTLFSINGQSTAGKILLESRGFFTDEYWYWICIGALGGFIVLFNILFLIALTVMDPLRNSRAVVADEKSDKKKKMSPPCDQRSEGMEMRGKGSSETVKSSEKAPMKGMVLPFQPLSLAFHHVNYYVDMPSEMKRSGSEKDRLQLLRDVSGAFRPGILTALIGVTGAGKTTLMDVLAGRKTGGYIEGSISVSGYPKNQSTFTRVSGYCEQNDIHSPNVTVYESLLFSAWLRLTKDVNNTTRKMFIEEVMDLVELNPIRGALVGLPGVDGLSTEQRKRLTIAVELVANPSIIFMDEPTSGLDARAAAIVMRTVRNTVDTGRTIVCTIHQPSIDIFESFDELMLMKQGGQLVYAGPLGRNSHKLIEYLEGIQGVPKIKEGTNPATWMLEVTSPAIEAQLNVDFAEIYAKSSLYKSNQNSVQELSTPPPGWSRDLFFASQYSQSFLVQCRACFWKQHWSYWRNTEYNGVRFLMTVIIGVLFGTIYWNKGQKTGTQQELMNLLGAIFAVVFFLGASNSNAVQPVIDIERTVFYRERAAGMYSALAYAFAQVAIEVIYVAVQALVYLLVLYPMIGFDPKAQKILWYYYYLFTSLAYFTAYGMMGVALTPNHQIGAVILFFFFSFWVLFCGFLVPRKQIPIWWRWYYWASPVSWTIHGLVATQLNDKDAAVEGPEFGVIPLRTYVSKVLDFDFDFLPYVALAHIGWVLLFLFVFAYGIKFLNFQKR